MRYLSLLSILLFQFSFSQFSKTHYIPPIVGVDGQPIQAQYLYISCPNPEPVNFNIQILGGGTINGTVSRDQPFEYQIGDGENSPMHIGNAFVNQIFTNKGCIVEAEDQIYVALRLTATPQNFQAGGLVSKGLAAPGKLFRIGAMVNDLIPNLRDIDLTFISILALENNTTITFSDIKPGAQLMNNAAAGNQPDPVVLNRGESYSIATKGTFTGNRNCLIGALVSSDKEIVVNCGSFAGTNASAQNNVDIGFDQIVDIIKLRGTDPTSDVGQKYIFIRAQGTEEMERPLLVAHENNTEVYLNGSATPNFVLNAGDFTTFAELNGLNFNINGNLYVYTSKPVYAYQGFGGTNQPQNQEMHFVPPLSCQTPRIIDNIPLLDNIGNLVFSDGFVNIVTETGATMDFRINGIIYNQNSLPSGVNISGPFAVDGNPEYVTYTLSGLSGNVAVFASGQVYLSYYGSNNAATYGGFYSGFTFKPEITYNAPNVGVDGCIPNVELSVSTLSPFDTYQWYLNGSPIAGATDSFYLPNEPGYYYLSATITECNITLISDEIPVSICTPDTDNDGVNNNIELDYDNDGILNCEESYGNFDFNLSNNSNTILVGNYNNSMQVDLANTNGYIGDVNSNVYLATPIGKDLTSKTRLNFTTPINIQVEYITTSTQANHLLNAHTDYIIRVPINHTITLVNPSGQLLVDTDYDGLYENNVSFYSSFEIRFRLSSNNNLAIGSGDFYFKSYECSFIEIEVKNTSDVLNSQNAFKVFAYCLPKDTDGDGIPNYYDSDSDNDGIPDTFEAQGINYIMPNNAFNPFGVDTAYGNGLSPIDTDGDGVPDYIDLDSDNDGIYDLNEAGHNALDVNNDGKIDGNNASFGTNGLQNSLETFDNSGVINYSIWDTDDDNFPNYIDLDSDGDNCNDVIEANFTDSDNDGQIGSAPFTVNINGLPTIGQGYTNPPFLNDYITPAPLSISEQPENLSGCERGNAIINMLSNDAETYQWQISTDGGASWVNLVENTTYIGTTTNTLEIVNITPIMNGHQFRAFINRNGNACGLYSEAAILTLFNLPILTDNLVLVQCEQQQTATALVNLTQKQPQISVNHLNETFEYYTGSFQAAFDANPAFLIANPEGYLTNDTTIWVRVINENDCFEVVTLQVVISSNSVTPDVIEISPQCEDPNEAGVANFDLSPALAYLETLLPNPIQFQISFYRTETDALLQTNAQGASLAIADITNYRNTDFPYSQTIWVRIENILDNDCFAAGPYVSITVDERPRLGDDLEVIKCDEDATTLLNPELLSGTPIQYEYQWFKNNVAINNATNYIYQADSSGNYTVKVTNINGCEATQNFLVIESGFATIENIEIIDMTNNNSITIITTGLGIYEYSIDGVNYFPNPTFANVLPNIYTVYVRDIFGCGIVKKQISVLGVPPFFTPNGDGYNDQWNLKGAIQADYPNAQLFVYDRYGKLISIFNPYRGGWDGKYNGFSLPATDYWYLLDLGTGRIVKGHFALLR